MTTNAAENAGYDYRAVQDAILTALANQQANHRVVDDVPVIAALHARMNPDLLVNDQGQVLLIHEKPMPDPIWWVEYDPEMRQLIFVTTTGQIMPFGLPIANVVDTFLRFAHMIYMIEIDHTGKMIRVDERRIVVREEGRE